MQLKYLIATEDTEDTEDTENCDEGFSTVIWVLSVADGSSVLCRQT